jgi:predicted transcriptional regulator
MSMIETDDSTVIGVKLPRSLADAAQVLARKQHTTRSTLLRQLIANAVPERGRCDGVSTLENFRAQADELVKRARKATGSVARGPHMPAAGNNGKDRAMPNDERGDDDTV